MILQKVIFPCEFAGNAEELYFRCGAGAVSDGEKISFSKGAVCSFDTVRAAFSVGKWHKYTEVRSITLSIKTDGIFTVTVYRRTSKDSTVNEKIREVKFFDEVNIELPVDGEGLYYFSLVAETDGAFLGAEYLTNDEPTSKVKLCSVICTYKRESFVRANIEQLRRDIILNRRSVAHGSFKVIVVDNGSTLEEETGDITVLHNKNAGGAGGFTRGMLEAIKLRDSEQITHILLTDDDIRFETESINITYAFLSYLRSYYKDAFFGGAMYRTDNPVMQSERANRWDFAKGRGIPIGHMLDMTDADNLLINETEKTAEINYFGWWYCVIPASVPEADNLPLPIFIKRDDIEYGLRNGRYFITLNSVFVWHEPFEAKRPAFMEYYYNRNQCIMESIHRADFSADILKNRMLKETVRGILTFRYNEVHAALRGVSDFLECPKFLFRTDPTALNAELLKLNYKTEEMPYPKDYEEEYKEVCAFGKRKKAIAIATANGWIFPFGKQVTVPAARPSWRAFYGAKSAINVDPSGKCFVTKRSLKEAKKCVSEFRRLTKKIDDGFDKAKSEYRAYFEKITGLEFWNAYLGLTNRMFDEEQTHAEELKTNVAISLLKWLKLCVHGVARLSFRLLSGIRPLRSDSILFISTKRKGFCCNPKYVILALRKKYGDKYKITWASDYPESCDEIRKLGIKVVKMNSLSYVRAQLGAKTVVYSDSVPSYMPKRSGQIYINLWHAAINYKHIGYDYLHDKTRVELKKFALRNPRPDYMISGSRFFTEDTAKSFRFDEEVFLPWGLPRNAVFFDSEMRRAAEERVRSTFGLSDEKIAIYAPTFRAGMLANTHGIDFEGVLSAFEKRFGGRWIIFYRGHGFVQGEVELADRVVDVTEYADVQELMAAADAMISDYSSAMWDMIFTDKPIFVYATDMLNYAENERSFAYPTDKWRFPIAQNNAELIQRIESFDKETFDKNMRLHLKEAGSYEDGKAAERVARLIDEHGVFDD